MDNPTFNTTEQEELQRYEEYSQQAAKQISTERGKSIFYSCFFALLAFFEYHVLYSVFRHIAGDDNPFWSPHIMGFSAFILVVAVHFLAQQSRQHPAIRFIDNAVGKMVPVYLIGIGLLLAVLLYKYGLSAMLDTDNAKLNIETMQMEGQSWVSWIVTYIVSPAAAIIFAAGLGSLAIVNVFVAHNAFDRAATARQTALDLAYTLTANQADISTYFDALARYEDTTAKLNAQHLLTDAELRAEVTSELTRQLQQANNQAIKAIAKAQS